MGEVRHVRVFKNGRSRAIRIPREYDIFGDEVVMRKELDRVILEPRRDRRTISEMMATWIEIEEDFLDPDDDPPPRPHDPLA